MVERIELEEPRDIRVLINSWIQEVCNNGRLPFEGAGTIVQMLNTWLRSYETEKNVEKVTELEKRIDALEHEKLQERIKVREP